MSPSAQNPWPLPKHHFQYQFYISPLSPCLQVTHEPQFLYFFKSIKSPEDLSMNPRPLFHSKRSYNKRLYEGDGWQKKVVPLFYQFFSVELLFLVFLSSLIYFKNCDNFLHRGAIATIVLGFLFCSIYISEKKILPTFCGGLQLVLEVR